MRPWSSIPIADCGEPLLELPGALPRLEPHPYAALGAPYGIGASPFRLRSGVIERLLLADSALRRQQPGWRLTIFDAWRPLAVQRFMVEHAIAEECRLRGVDPHRPSPALAAVQAEVGRFWAPPSDDPTTPPPHSTGAAVDLTLADAEGRELNLGSPIDAIGAVSEPDHFASGAPATTAGTAGASEAEAQAMEAEAREWHRRRTLLREAMASAGFAQHPNEWWHFSWGDQLWAWRSGAACARYGRWLETG
ncbi:M15 family metallopeptidase [Vulcanococcus limneticus]|uniref:M15 family metallopeptidase n=1 Tax=Vulcanococcus limneticus TaxID=2170428 RepID=UPI00398BCEED